MSIVYVQLKDGTTRSGPLWMWRPKEGWFLLAEEGDDVEPILLAECVSVINRSERVGPSGQVGDVDLLERARKEGWIDGNQLLPP